MSTSEFYRYAGKKAPQGSPESSFNENAPPPAMLDDGHSYYIANGYFIPCYVPKKYANGNGYDITPDKQEKQDRFALAEAMTTRYFHSVERSTHIHRSYTQIQELKSRYENAATGSYERQRRGALYVGALVMRTQELSEAILHGKGHYPLHHEKDAPTAENEIQEHFITFMTNLDRFPEVNLQGNKPDLDKIIPEMLSEVAKAAAKRDGEFLVPFKMLHENHVIKIGGAMKIIDETGRQIETLTKTVIVQEVIALRQQMQHYINAARQRAGIRSMDAGHFEEAEVIYKVARDHVDETLETLRVKTRRLPSSNKLIELIKEGRQLVDELSYYRNPMPKTLARYSEEVVAYVQQQGRQSAVR